MVILQPFSLPIPAASSVALMVRGSQLRCTDTQSATDLTISVGNGPPAPLWAGWALQSRDGTPLGEARIFGGALDIVVELFTSDGTFTDSRITGTVDATLTRPDTLAAGTRVTVPTATPTAILAADATRRSAFIQADSGNAGIVYVGAATIDAVTKGIELAPGEVLPVDGTYAVSCYHALGVDCHVRAWSGTKA